LVKNRKSSYFYRGLIKSESEIEIMRRSGKVAARCMQTLSMLIKPGISTLELDEVAEKTILGLGAKSAFKGQYDYPYTLCLGINEEVVHGLPSKNRILQEGDIIAVDLGAILDGWYSDMAYTFSVGSVSDEAKNLLEAGQEALAAGMNECFPDSDLHSIGRAIQAVADKWGFSSVRDLCGHGVGKKLHESPQVPLYYLPDSGFKLKAGMTLAIEPMLCLGGYQVILAQDNWTYLTKDGKIASQFEHTVLVTDNGPEVLTKL